ncbi:hypothetical protein ACOMHN_009947 [Nucella lapillus]
MTETIDQTAAEDEEMETVQQCTEIQRWRNCVLYFCVGNLVLRGSCTVIPKKSRPRILALAHEGFFWVFLGMVRMKQNGENLQTKVWWPGMEREAKKFCKICHGCQLVGRPNPQEPVS